MLPVIFTEIVQNVFAATVPPVRLIDVLPPVAVTDPPQLFANPGAVETVSPAGKLSVNARPVSVMLFVFVILKETVVLPPSGIVGEANVFKIIGGETTVRFALDELPVPPSVDETGPAVLVYAPAVFPVTLNEIVQNVFAARVPPVKLIDVVPATAVTEPPHVLLVLGVDEITRPVGSVSLTASPLSVMLFALVIFSVSVVLPPIGTVDTAKLFKSTGGAATVRLALEELPVPPSFDVTGPAVFV